MMGSYFILCVFLASFCGVIATPVKDSENVTTQEKEQCGCSNDIQQIYAELRELREEQNRIKTLENHQPGMKIAADDLPVNIDTRAVFPDVIGFTATFSNIVNDIALGSTLIFDKIIYNAGDHYDPNTGIFTCPRSGMYLFSVFVEPRSNPVVIEAEVRIVINGDEHSWAITEPTEIGHDTMGGSILIYHLQKGDRVWVETFETDDQGLNGEFNSFSGVLIQSTSLD